MKPKKQQTQSRKIKTSWDPVADWYDGWVGKRGSEHHRQVAIPALLQLLEPQPDETLLDIGAGQGVLAPYVRAAGTVYTGVDVSRKLLRRARRHHPQARFVWGDARRLAQVAELKGASFDTAVFLLSIQDMQPLEPVLASAAWALKPNGRLVILMTHPCFRVPRQSGWGWDPGRKLRYRRVDSYLSRLQVPMKAFPGRQRGKTRSFHRPLQAYVNGLAACGLVIDQIREIPARDVMGRNGRRQADKRAEAEIPLFLGIRAIKMKS